MPSNSNFSLSFFSLENVSKINSFIPTHTHSLPFQDSFFLQGMRSREARPKDDPAESVPRMLRWVLPSYEEASFEEHRSDPLRAYLALRDGVALCELVPRLFPHAPPLTHVTRNPRYLAQCLDNLAMFLAACDANHRVRLFRFLPVDLYHGSDLYSVHRFLLGLHAAASTGSACGLSASPSLSSVPSSSSSSLLSPQTSTNQSEQKDTNEKETSETETSEQEEKEIKSHLEVEREAQVRLVEARLAAEREIAARLEAQARVEAEREADARLAEANLAVERLVKARLEAEREAEALLEAESQVEARLALERESEARLEVDARVDAAREVEMRLVAAEREITARLETQAVEESPRHHHRYTPHRSSRSRSSSSSKKSSRNGTSNPSSTGHRKHSAATPSIPSTTTSSSSSSVSPSEPQSVDAPRSRRRRADQPLTASGDLQQPRPRSHRKSARVPHKTKTPGGKKRSSRSKSGQAEGSPSAQVVPPANLSLSIPAAPSLAPAEEQDALSPRSASQLKNQHDANIARRIISVKNSPLRPIATPLSFHPPPSASRSNHAARAVTLADQVLAEANALAASHHKS